ncbi:FAD-binding oxidoreductase [Leekyejoonella antrihumi]|uniref:FAD-binding oxidoreductase n=1 Tax=Leekyejoonella antrihumi TaxID=1660198 RepID=A0A563DTN6_9MICO|nr:FAD-binding oxidoreductase [Leekyejoonella antrihumi]TWP33630.1 FAD-binding oxidoreductase [Leekyejoonella antrihumi]
MALFDALREHDIDARAAVPGDEIDGSLPRLITLPADTQQVSTILRTAAADGATVAVAGHGTKQTWGTPTGAVDVVVNLSRIDQIVEHQPGDLIVTAQAGVPLAALQASLGASTQRLALDEMVPGTTVGGLIATNPSGPRRLHAGTVRDLLIGLTLVRPDGTIARAGGKVVKNVAGYDLCKLLTGSWGTLGVITEATFRLHPVPAATRWLTAHVPDHDLPDLLKSVMHSQLTPSAVEVDTNDSSDGHTQVAVLLEGTPGGVDARAREMTRLLAHGADQGDAGWTTHYPFRLGGTQIGLKITCAIGAVTGVARRARDLGLHVRGSAGTGVLYAAVADEADLTSAHLQTLRAEAARAGGSVTIVDGPRAVRAALDVWGPVSGLRIMHRIKDEFDPDHRLQPGRFVGGI